MDATSGALLVRPRPCLLRTAKRQSRKTGPDSSHICALRRRHRRNHCRPTHPGPTGAAQSVRPLGTVMNRLAEIGGPTTATWGEEILARAEELSGLASWIEAQPDKHTPTGNMPTMV